MPPRAPTRADWFRLLALTACWGTAFLLNELALAAFDPWLIVAARIVLGTAVLVTYIRVTGVRLPRSVSAWIPMGITAIFGVLLPFFLTLRAQTHLDSSVTAVLMAIMPLMVISLAHAFVPGERLTIARLLGFASGFIGVVLVVAPGMQGASGMHLGASVAVLGAALSYSATSVYARLHSTALPAAMATGMLLIATTIAVPVATLENNGLPSDPELAATIAVILLGIFATGVASVLYFQVLAGPGPSFLSIVNYLVPAWAVLLGVLVLGEQLSGRILTGLGTILLGIAISEFGGRLTALRRTGTGGRPVDVARH
jgi:drug/metabolite transporter (DMT)-like permease